jgi:hypothetical protein
MGELADLLDGLTIAVSSPDRNITAYLDGRGRFVDIELDQRDFRRYAGGELARQLSQLGRLAYVAYRQEHRRLTGEVFARPSYDDMVDEVGPELREYRRRLAEVVSHGTGGDGQVRISAHGLADWEVRLPPNLSQRMTVDAFLDELRTAVAEVLADYGTQAIAIRRQVYGPVESVVPVPGKGAGGPLDRLRYQVAGAIRAGSRTSR